MNEALHQLALKRMVELRLQGMSTRKIAEALNAENLRGQLWGRWHPNAVLKELPGLGFDPSQPGVIIIEHEGTHIPVVGGIYHANFHGKVIQGQVVSRDGKTVRLRVGNFKVFVGPQLPRLGPGELEELFPLPTNHMIIENPI